MINIVPGSMDLNIKGIYYFMKYRASPFSPLFVPYVFNISDALLTSIWIGVYRAPQCCRRRLLYCKKNERGGGQKSLTTMLSCDESGFDRVFKTTVLHRYILFTMYRFFCPRWIFQVPIKTPKFGTLKVIKSG